MIILQPITSQQTISVIPRFSSCIDVDFFIARVGKSNVEAEDCLTDAVGEFNNVSIYLRRDGDGISETIEDVVTEKNGGYVDYTFISEILEEGSTYFIQITESGDLSYRDKIYVTNRTQEEIETTKHVIGKNYKPYEANDDNTYII